jgi:hypothetical protein
VGDPPLPASQVNGLALSPRIFNNDMTLRFAGNGNNFDSHTLNGLHNASGFDLYFRPCRNCKAMLPKLDVTVDLAYNTHMNDLYGPLAAQNIRDD